MKNLTLDPKLWDTDKGYTRFSKPAAQFYEFYLSGTVQGPEEYIDWFDTIRHALPEDHIKIYINSHGGSLDTTLQFLRVLGETRATVTTSVEGTCMSAATMIFLHGHQHEVTPHSMFMFHNYSGGTFGKGGEMYGQLQFERAWSENFLREVYKNFLVEDEIQAILHNKDLWMTSEEVVARLQKAAANLAEENASVAEE